MKFKGITGLNKLMEAKALSGNTDTERANPTKTALVVREELKQQHGFVQGGVVSYLADNALTYAGGSVLGDAVKLLTKYAMATPSAKLAKMILQRLQIGSQKPQKRGRNIGIASFSETRGDDHQNFFFQHPGGLHQGKRIAVGKRGAALSETDCREIAPLLFKMWNRVSRLTAIH